MSRGLSLALVVRRAPEIYIAHGAGVRQKIAERQTPGSDTQFGKHLFRRRDPDSRHEIW